MNSSQGSFSCIEQGSSSLGLCQKGTQERLDPGLWSEVFVTLLDFILLSGFLYMSVILLA